MWLIQTTETLVHQQLKFKPDSMVYIRAFTEISHVTHMWFTHVKFQKHMWISYPMCFTWDYFHMWNTCAINMCFTCVSHVKSHMWKIPCEISHVTAFHMWNFTCEISHVKFHMWNFTCEISHGKFQNLRNRLYCSQNLAISKQVKFLVGQFLVVGTSGPKISLFLDDLICFLLMRGRQNVN